MDPIFSLPRRTFSMLRRTFFYSKWDFSSMPRTKMSTTWKKEKDKFNSLILFCALFTSYRHDLPMGPFDFDWWTSSVIAEGLDSIDGLVVRKHSQIKWKTKKEPKEVKSNDGVIRRNLDRIRISAATPLPSNPSRYSQVSLTENFLQEFTSP